MDNEKLIRKYELATSETYQQIRSEAVNFIVKMSTTTLSPEVLKGMLLLLREIDGWVDEYKNELARRKE